MDHVPTVFIESPPPPPPAPPPREDRGGVVISRGFLGMLVVLLLGAAIAGTGYFYLQYKTANDKVVGYEKKDLPDLKAAVAARDKIVADQKTLITARDQTIENNKLQYGQIEQLTADGDKLQKDIDDLLKRRPGTPGLPDRLKSAPVWRDAAVQQLTRYVSDLQKEFQRIDRAAAPPPVSTEPVKPRITPSTSTCTAGTAGCP